MKNRTPLLLAIALLANPVSAAETVVGKPVIEDGDTLIFDGRRINLEAIDAPELGQVCYSKAINRRKVDVSSKFDGGAASRQALREIIAGQVVTCKINERLANDFEHAACSTATVPSISFQMLKEGMAFWTGKGETSLPFHETQTVLSINARTGNGIYQIDGRYRKKCLSPYWERKRRNIKQP